MLADPPPTPIPAATPTPIPAVPSVILAGNGVQKPQQLIIAEGQPVNINWTSTNVNPNSCVTSGGSTGWPGANRPAQDQSASYTYTPEYGIYTYQINCTGPGGAAQSSITVEVRRPVLNLSLGSRNCSIVNLSWSWQDAYPAYLASIQKYQILRDGILIADNLPPSQSTYQDNSAFVSGQNYTYKVQAIRSVPPSPVVSAQIQGIPCPNLPSWQEVIPRI